MIIKKIQIIVYLTLLAISFSSAFEWNYGSTHVHTGYSTWWGYDGNPLTFGDDCTPRALEGPSNLNPLLAGLGYTVTELKQQALNLNLHWLAFSDHSYCIDSSEFNMVKADCQNAQDSGFTCLWGEELSAAEIVGDIEPIPLGCDPFGIGDDGEAHIGAYGIDNFITQNPTNLHCPFSPNVSQGINSINGQNGFSIANHPYLREGGVEFLDFESIDIITGETGIEIWNAGWDSSVIGISSSNDERAKNNWISKLQNGERVYAYGGTDSHYVANTVNYNLAGVSSLTHSALESGLSAGTNVVSNNGYVVIEAKKNSQSTWTQMGGEISANTNDILNMRIIPGVINSCTLRVYKSTIGSNLELTHYGPVTINGGSSPITLPNLALANPAEMYFRAECIGSGGTYRTYTNPIWLTVLSSSCQCGNWIPGSCGGGSCSAGQRLETRTCNPVACSAETRCVNDALCSNSGNNTGQGVSVCNEPGYEQCFRYTNSTLGCSVAVAANYYGAVNNISWGQVVDSSDPYVINNYKVGWKRVDGERSYYDGSNCAYGGCSGQLLSGTEGTVTTVNAPGTAHSEELLVHRNTAPSTWCAVWFNSFNPNYNNGADPIYVLNCYSNGDCSGSQYCNKVGSWNTWSCVNYTKS